MTGISCDLAIEYAQIPGFRPLELDLYLPDPAARASPGPVPVVVHVHGGGWLSGEARYPAAVDGVVAWFPVTDLTSVHGPDDDDPQTREALFLGAPPSLVPELARAASPLTHVHAGAPPVLLLHGDSDTLVPPDQSIRFAQALQDAGGTVSLVLVPGASHFWDGADDVPGIVAQSASFAASLVPLEV